MKLISVLILLLVLGTGLTPAAAETRPAAAGVESFAWSAYRPLRARHQNLAFSPYSLSAALAMTRAGACGVTGREMDQVLHLPEEPHAAWKELLADLAVLSGDQVSLVTANRLWLAAGLSPLPAYLEKAGDCYAAAAEVLPADPAQGAERINGWVSGITEGEIPELLKASDLAGDVPLVLTNAVLFRGKWAVPFDPAVTRQGVFHSGGTRPTSVPMMTQLGAFNLFEARTARLLEIPYGDGRFSMVVVLPHERDGLVLAEDEICQAGGIGALLDAPGGTESIEISLPRFKLDTQFRLKPVLRELGMQSAFTAGADFSALGPEDSLWIGEVIHQATVCVDEEGTVAAAATAVVTVRSMPARFVVDHPFLFVIRDQQTGTILFVGRVWELG